ncbi:MAG: hypothetical protein EXR72_11040 [Myxococcales bacterium]|nr:hypothetical protein [Myxococcales bacterium]
MPSLRTGRLRLRLRDEQEPARGPPPLLSTPAAEAEQPHRERHLGSTRVLVGVGEHQAHPSAGAHDGHRLALARAIERLDRHRSVDGQRIEGPGQVPACAQLRLVLRWAVDRQPEPPREGRCVDAVQVVGHHQNRRPAPRGDLGERLLHDRNGR